MDSHGILFQDNRVNGPLQLRQVRGQTLGTGNDLKYSMVGIHMVGIHVCRFSFLLKLDLAFADVFRRP